MQDVLDLGSEARMNTPSMPEENWNWRCPEGVLTEQLAASLSALTEVADRESVPEISENGGK